MSNIINGTTLVEKESRSIGDVPVGGIISWAKTLSGVPNLAEGWVECDGSVLTDSQSSLNGQTIPDLNGGIFLRGDTTSGGTGGSATMAHTHTLTSAFAAVGMASGTNEVFLKQSTDASADFTKNHTLTDLTVTANSAAVSNNATELIGSTDAASNAENRPPYYNIVWIMRVR